jgi:hypothetical protein
MLNILEKLQYGLSALVVIGSIALYLWQGTDSRPPDMIEAPTKLKNSSRPAPPPRPGAKALTPAPSPTAAEDKTLLDRLASEQNVQGAATIEHENYAVKQDTIDYISTEKNWLPELKKAASQLLPGADGKSSRIQLSSIEDDSLFKKFGLKDNDIVEFIDGEKIDFENSTNMQHIERWNKIKGKMLKGEKIGLTVTRNGQPMQIEFKLGR